MKKLLALFLAFSMIFSSIAALAEIDIALDTIEIYTADDLITVAESVYATNFAGKTIVLMDDIDLGNEEWTPIGNPSNPFKGNFNGNGKKISNLTINRSLTNSSANNGVGLFGTATGGTIENFTLENVDITGSLWVGAVIGGWETNVSTVKDVKIQGLVNIDGYWYVGGIVGKGYGSAYNCSINATNNSYIKGNNGSYIGGIWGFKGEGGSKIENCSVSGLEITGVDRVGGISGIAHYGNTISGCNVSNTTVEATDPDATTVGIIAGACQGTDSSPSIVEDNTVAEDVTASVAGKPIAGTVGTNINGSKPVVDTEAAKIGTTYYKTLADALTAAALVDGAVTIDLVSDATWETGAAHGSTPLIPADSAAIVTINGNGNTITATGAGVGPIRAANDTLLTFNNVNIVDRSESYAESSWEFGYLEFAGKLAFIDCDFTGAIQIQSETDNIADVDFTNCSFKSEKDSEYAVWLSDGTTSFDNCSFTGTRGLKMHEAYGSEVTSVEVEKCTFTGLSKKPAIAIGTVNAATSVAISDCEITDVQAGDQGVYLLESDTDVSTFNYVAENNKITIDEEIITPGAKISTKEYPTFESALAVAVDGDVIDLLGNTHKLTNTNKNVKGKSLTIENGTFDLGNTAWSGNSVFDIDNGGYLTLNNVDFVGNGYSSAYGVLYAHGKSTVELNNCDFDLKNEQFSAGGVLKGNGVADSTFIVNGSTFDLENPNRVIANATVALTGVTIDAAVTNKDLVVGDLNNHAFRNLVGRVINSTITVDGFETGIKNTDGNLEITGNSVITLKNSKVADLVIGSGKKVDVATTATLAYTTSDIASDAVSSNPVADANGVQYFTLQDAVAAAKAGETVTLYKDVAETIVFPATPAVRTFALRATAVPTGVTLDLKGFTLTGNIVVEAGAVATIKDGKIVNEYASVNAIESYGEVILTNIDATSARSVVRIEGGVAEINGGSYKVNNTTNSTIHALNVSGNSVVTVKDGTFIADGGLNEASAAVQVRDDAVVTIENGTFKNGVLSTLAAAKKENIVVKGGLFDQDPTAYVATGYKAIVDTYGMYKVVGAAHEFETVSVKFEKVNTVEGEALYDIYLIGSNWCGINRLNSADLTFKFTPNPVTGSQMAYEILEIDNISVTNSPNQGEEHRYMFNYDSKTNADDTGIFRRIGQVKVTGYGTFSFEVDATATTNEVHATTEKDNVVDTFVPNGKLEDGEGVFDISAKLENIEIKVPTRKLTIQIAFPNAISGNAAAYQDMKVEISGNIEGKQQTVKTDLGTIDVNGGYVVTEDRLVLNETYNVTVSGAGYRTARYTVTMTENKTLNFWNNVKDNDTVVEIGKDTSATKVTFLAGDIVKDNNINIYDLSAVVSYFGTVDLNTNPETYKYAKYDLNRDGKIDSKDVAYVLVSWNK